MEEMLIRISGNDLPLVTIKNNGSVREQYVDPEQLILVLARYAKEELVWKSPTLPKGTVRYLQANEKELLVLEVEPLMSNVRYHEATIEHVHFPKMLFAFSIKDMVVGSCCIVAVTDREITDNTQIYACPFSNVYGNTKACWHELPVRIDSYTEISRIPYRWYGSENTSSLYGSNKSGLSYREFLEHNSQAKRDSFDASHLYPLEKTFAAWIESINE